MTDIVAGGRHCILPAGHEGACILKEKNMSDIVERARARNANHSPQIAIIDEMADEIERLRQLYRDATADLNRQIEDKQYLAGEIERLRAEIRRLEKLGWPQGIGS